MLSTSRILVQSFSSSKQRICSSIYHEQLVLRRSIAKTTSPCLFAVKKKKIRSRHKTSKPNASAVSQNTKPTKPVREDMNKRVKEWNAKTMQSTTIPFAEVKVATGPPATMSHFEFKIRERILVNKFERIANRKGISLDDPSEEINAKLRPLTLSEVQTLVLLVASAANVPDHIAAALRKIAFSKDSQLENIEKLSSDVATMLTDVMLGQLNHLQIRILDAAATKEEKTEMIEEWTKLNFSTKEPPALSYLDFATDDDGMIPPLDYEECYTGKHVDTVDEQNAIKKGDIVLCVAPDLQGVVRRRVFRVTGLAGDIVKDIYQNFCRVPEGHFWAEGDQKWWAIDSRVHGPIPLSNLRFRFDPLLEQDPDEALSLRFRPFRDFLLGYAIFPVMDAYFSFRNKV